MWASAPTNVCEKRTGRTESSVPYKDLQWNENILHHRRIRRCAVISTAGCFAISLRGNCFRWERCLHAGGAAVQFCRQFIVCWCNVFLRAHSVACGTIRSASKRLFLPTFSGKTDGTKLQTSEAFAIWRGRTTERTRPAACGGARDVEFVRTRVCEATAAVSLQKRQSGETGKRACRIMTIRAPARRADGSACAGAAHGWRR